jgi:hypothetical protein
VASRRFDGGVDAGFLSFTQRHHHQRDEAFAIMHHLWQNPPSYAIVDTKSDVADKSPRITENDGTMLDLSSYMGGGQKQATMRDDVVDTESSRRALQKMYVSSFCVRLFLTPPV